ncbi:MAG: bifunctional diaminohydroxyphosphoribosylaminopyrimidine deaminase/5-amino-6-(5-phosphoribosylamino)uracil reductase RibD [Gemmataceae bacterium]|nr:bifunctional diaminohydroxyphosphoribosylaminopyrimidine deaminase/5-amino-6-(5-phosphoribosylamino)uracil reductase RibD [Gemmataceae bacterium]
MDDDSLMRHALGLAERGRGAVEPNPLVGAVIARDGRIIGEGWHAKFGGDHAEVVALRHAGEKCRGATLYVTLEPCSHFGKTPPCADAVIAAGITRVVVAMSDPFPEVAGRGLDRIRAAGIAVTLGVCESEARRLNRPYLTLLSAARPYVHLKWAMSLDGKIASRTGDSKWISGEESRRLVHQLRGRVDAIIVGAGTVRADDPLLTARPPGPRTPARIVLASRPELPADCQLLRTAGDSPVIVVSPTPATIPGAEVLVADGLPSLLAELGRRRMTQILVEGGAKVIGSFLDAGLVDECHVFIAPILVGGPAGASAGHGVATIADSLRLTECSARTVGSDVYLHGLI